jgi:hypothetical protein
LLGTYGKSEEYVEGFGGENLKERHHLEDLGVDGNIVLRFN